MIPLDYERFDEYAMTWRTHPSCSVLWFRISSLKVIERRSKVSKSSPSFNFLDFDNHLAFNSYYFRHIIRQP